MVNEPTPDPPTTDEETDVEGFILDGLGNPLTVPVIQGGSAASKGNLAQKRLIRDAQRSLE